MLLVVGVVGSLLSFQETSGLLGATGTALLLGLAIGGGLSLINSARREAAKAD